MEYSREDREPDANGIYWVQMVCDGEAVKIPVKDRRLVRAMDDRNVMGLDLDRDGYVTAVYDPEKLTPLARKLYIKHTDGKTVQANGSMALNGKDYTLELTEKTQIYDVMLGSPMLGEKRSAETLAFSDAFVAYTDENGQVSHVFLTAHSGSSNIYWRTVRMYNNGAKKTIRVPDAEGAYSIEFACNGKLETLKCKDEALEARSIRRGMLRRLSASSLIRKAIFLRSGISGWAPTASGFATAMWFALLRARPLPQPIRKAPWSPLPPHCRMSAASTMLAPQPSGKVPLAAKWSLCRKVTGSTSGPMRTARR